MFFHFFIYNIYRYRHPQIFSFDLELKLRCAINLPSCLPAYIIFMCVRHANYINNHEKIRSFFSLVIALFSIWSKKKKEEFHTLNLRLVTSGRFHQLWTNISFTVVQFQTLPSFYDHKSLILLVLAFSKRVTPFIASYTNEKRETIYLKT